MKCSYKWLNEYVNISKRKIELVAEKLTYAGVEVESVEQLSTATGVVVGYVNSKKQHPNADKLSVCQVDIGEKNPKQIVCGAKNIDEGQYVIVAKVGAKLPNGIEIADVEMRGVKSSGMICSLSELGISKNLIPSEFSEGIYVFNVEYDEIPKIGADAIKALYFDDDVMELSLTPNRSDCLSVEGIAYEVAALYSLPVVESPKRSISKNTKQRTFKLNVKTKNCLSFHGAHLKKIEIKPSPRWLQARLIACGIRPINNVVDITNYAMLITGQPMHAYDFSKIANSVINVGMAKGNSSVVTLDGVENKLLKDKDITIYDDEKPLGIAGVMGMQSSEVSTSTQEIFLEVATFSGMHVRESAKRLGYKTEASKRFEKNLCPLTALKGFQTALYLFKEICGAKIAYTEVYNKNKKLVSLKTKKLSLKKINDVLGMNLTEEDVRDVFKRLNFNFASFAGKFVVYIPFRRQDINITEDIIEEIGRIHGYDSIKTSIPRSNLIGSLSPIQALKRDIKNVLEAKGLNEVINYSLTTDKKDNLFSLENVDGVRLLHPMSEERVMYRTQILEGLLNSAKYNQARNGESISLYEMSNTFSLKNKSYVENFELAGLISEAKDCNGENVFYCAKNILNEIFLKCNILKEIDIVPNTNEKSFHPGRTANIILKDSSEVLGIVGELHPNILNDYDLKRTVVFKLDFNKLSECKKDMVLYVPISKYPEVTRDIAFELSKDILVGDIIKTIYDIQSPLLKDVNVIDVYCGEKIDNDKKSVTFNLKLSSVERTLEANEINDLVNTVIDNVCKNHNAKLRS